MAAELVHHTLLALCVVALGGAALRIASLTGAAGLVRVVAAVPIGVAAAALQALALGLFAAGTSPVALGIAAAATWGLAWRFLPRPAPSPAVELRSWWEGCPLRARLAVGAGLGAGLAWSAWYVRHPVIGPDGLNYHLPGVAAWVESGRPGSLHSALHDIPVGNYPLTNEVVLAWLCGISRSLVPVTLWMMPCMVALAAASTWQGLRSLEVPRHAALLAVAALCGSPVVLVQLGGPNTEVPAVAWTVCTAALCAASLARPALLAPALVAAGLALGTKTTTVLPVALALAAAGWANRNALRALGRPFALAALAAVAAGGIWYLRNLLDHGSPLWPFVAAPWGDPQPPALALVDGRLISDPLATLEGRTSEYFDVLGGWTVLLLGMLVAPLIVRRREVAAASAATLLALLAWSASPFTGFPRGVDWTPLAIGSTRYLAPTAAIAALAVALAARASGWAGRAAAILLAAAAAINVARAADLGFPLLPTLKALALGALLGLLTALVVSVARGRVRLGGAVARGRVRLAGAVALAPAAIAVLLAVPAALAARGYPERHVAAWPTPPAIAWLVRQPGFSDGEAPIAMAPHLNGILVGERFGHRLELIPLGEPCARTRRRAVRGLVIVDRTPAGPPFSALGDLPFPSLKQAGRVAACLSHVRPAHREAGYEIVGVPR